MNRLAAAFALSILVLAVGSGCKGRAQATEPTAHSTLRVAWWGSQARHERTIRALQLF
jgi:hypothetical protein